MPEMYQVYIIKNQADQKYIGLSEDIEKRLADHNLGKSKWTKGKGPWKVVRESSEMSLSEARKLENKMKRQKGGVGLQSLMDAYGS